HDAVADRPPVGASLAVGGEAHPVLGHVEHPDTEDHAVERSTEGADPVDARGCIGTVDPQVGDAGLVYHGNGAVDMDDTRLAQARAGPGDGRFDDGTRVVGRRCRVHARTGGDRTEQERTRPDDQWSARAVGTGRQVYDAAGALIGGRGQRIV